jgi:hypothetical protein
MESGRSRPDQDTLVPLRPSEEFLAARKLDPETLAKFHEFSEPAQATTWRWVRDYADKLIEAAFIAKQNVNGDNVSEANVYEAAYSLNKKERRGFAKLAGIFGGIFLGTGVSTLVSVIRDNKFDRNGIILSAVSGILGAFLIAIDLPQGILPRRQKRTSTIPTRPVVKRRSAIPRTPK